MLMNSTPRRASDAVERAARAVRQLPVPKEFQDDLLLAQYILLCVANHTHPSANTPEDEQSLQDFINHMKQAALGNE